MFGNKTITIDGTTFNIALKERFLLKKNGCTISEFSEKVNGCNNPYVDISYREIKMLINDYIINKKLNDKFGQYIKFKGNNIIQKSNNLYDLLEVSNIHEKDLSFGFEIAESGKHQKISSSYALFGSNINYSQFDNKFISYAVKYLNSWIDKTTSFNDTKFAKDMFLSIPKEKIIKHSFEEHKIRLLKWKSFMFARALGERIKVYQAFNNRALNIPEERLCSCLNNLQKRYSINYKSLMERVDVLSKYKNNSGLYILVLSSLRGIYIGQATSSISKRILEHLNNPSSFFDDSILPEDISDIYVLKTPNDSKMIDLIERDLIAAIGPDLSMNASVGGHNVIASVHDVRYNPSEFTLSDDKLKTILNSLKDNQ